MKNKQALWYGGYALSVLLVFVLLFTDLPRPVDLAIGVLFSVVLSVSHVQLLHGKMLREDKDYRVSVLDERNISIKEKAGNIANMVNMALLSCATILFIAFDYIMPAILLGGILVLQPLILIAITNQVEKNM